MIERILIALRIIRPASTNSPIQDCVQMAVEEYQRAECKLNVALDADLVDAAIYDYLGAKKRLNYLFRAAQQEQRAAIS